MPLAQQYLFVIGAFQGLLLAGLLPWGDHVRNANRVLALWCVLLAIRFLSPFIYLTPQINPFTPLIGMSFFLPAGFGALLYLYCRHAIVDRPLSRTDLWHFVPLASCYLINPELVFASSEARLAMVTLGPPGSWRLDLTQYILYGQAFIYIGLAAKLVYHYQRRAGDTLSDYHPGIFRWLWSMLVLNLLIWSLKVTSELLGFRYGLHFVSELLIVVLIYSISMAQWRNPDLFRIAHLDERKGDEQKTTDTEQDNGALNDSLRTELSAEVHRHMQQQQLFLDSRLTLARLSEAVGVSTHHLSEVLNQGEGKNFYQFVNEYRVSHFCDQLKADPDARIIDLAMAAGFSSKSTFNAVFKQTLQLTPSQYRAQLKSPL